MALITLAERCRRIEMLILDVDGVLTEGSIIYSDAKNEVKLFHVRDGWALKRWHQCGKESAIISGRRSAVVDIRAAELGIKTVLQGSVDKLPGFSGVLDEHRLRAEQVAFVGDDVPDVSVMERSGLAVAVADACPEALKAAHFVTRSAGGRGAVREVIELVMRCQNLMTSDL